MRVWAPCRTSRLSTAAAQGAIHQTEGFFTFGLAFALLLLEAWLLAMLWPRSWRRQRSRRSWA